jgi:hypothetical protein
MTSSTPTHHDSVMTMTLSHYSVSKDTLGTVRYARYVDLYER